jgi:hypothetical protein
MASRLLTGKALAAFAAATVFSAGAAAAATGHLPDPVQHAVSTSLSHVGVDLPEPHESTATTDSNDNRDESTDASTSSGTIATGEDVRGKGPDANGPAQFGLCTAFLASVNAKGKNMDAPPFRNLAAAAIKANLSLKDFCIQATTGSTTTSSSTSSTSTTAPGSTTTTSSTVETTPEFPGNSGNTPAATAPGRLAGHGNGHG